MAPKTSDDNPRLRLASELVENTGVNVFLTGKAGTGKTTFLRSLRSRTRKRAVVLAPTGIAAINAGGMTIHSFFQLDFAPFFPGVGRSGGKGRFDRFRRDKLRVIRSLDLLIIDEVSMVRSDLLDAVDDVLRRHRDPTRPFGGVQLLLIGDLQQLPPVVKEDEWASLSQYYRTPYFFDSHALGATDYVTVELDKVYRQSEGEFLDILNRIRTNTADADVLGRLNTRYIPGFKPKKGERYVRLTTHNYQADAINFECMRKLRTPSVTFEASVEGTFPESSFPAAQDLTLKVGAQVMFIKNDNAAGYYNGMLGEVVEASVEDGVKVKAEDTGNEILVAPVTWDNVKYEIDPKTNAIKEETIGTFTQIPLRPAWAITIHKSQGLTFDRAVIDASGSFAHGQTYVALSRCRTLEGLVLDAPLTLSSIISDPTVSLFMHAQEQRVPGKEDVARMAQAYGVHLLRELFGFERLAMAWRDLRRVVDEAYSSIYPRVCEAYGNHEGVFDRDVRQVSLRFARQFEALVMESDAPLEENATLQERIHAGAGYFAAKLHDLHKLIQATPADHDNATLQARLRDRLAAFRDALALQEELLKVFSEEDFTTTHYLSRKADIVLAVEKGRTVPVSRGGREEREEIDEREGRGRRGDGPRRRSEATDASEARRAARVAMEEGANPEVYKALCAWRARKAKATGKAAFTILHTKTVLALAQECPRDPLGLRKVSGMGPTKIRQFGEEILEVIASALRG